MPHYDNNHYVPKKVLNNFAKQEDNGKYKINIIDLSKKIVVKRNTQSVFYYKNLYDVKKEDVKKLEKDLNTKIERPFYNILDRLVNEEKDTFTITRSELEIIKKYLLIQKYRNLKNSFGYNEDCDKETVLSRYNIGENEKQIDFWKREIQTILDNSLDNLVFNQDLIGVKQKSRNIFTGFLMFVHTCYEFLINDLGYVSERVPVEIKMSPKEYAELNEEIGKQLYGAEGFGKIAQRRAEENSEYMDNYLFFPVSSDLAILIVDEFWKNFYVHSLDIEKFGVSPSPLLSKHFSFPVNNYVNKKLIKKDSDIQKYKSKNDKYTYKIHELDYFETIYINNLLMNEAHRYVGYKTKDLIMPSIAMYVMKQKVGIENVKNDFEFVLLGEDN